MLGSFCKNYVKLTDLLLNHTIGSFYQILLLLFLHCTAEVRTQCGKLGIFPSLEFYVKSILVDLESQKMLQLEKFKTFRVIKIAALKILKVPQLISRKIVNFGFSKLPFSLLKIGQTCGSGQFEQLHFAKIVKSTIS